MLKPMTPEQLDALRPKPPVQQPFPNELELSKLLGFGDGLPAAPARRLAALITNLHTRLASLESAVNNNAVETR